MIKKLPLLLLVVCLAACENTPKKTKEISDYTERTQNRFPSSLQNVFDAHGGLNNWKSMSSLQFVIEADSLKETHTTDLKSRKARIESDQYTLGFDGENVWINNTEDSFKSDPAFYYNLMFYFYAMPFVISDPGVFYTERKDTNLKFETYGAIHIGFSRSVGASPKDEYIIYYHKKTFEMVWLAYTVTYFDKKRSTEWHYIKYENWQTVNGLKLPKTLVWYDVKKGKPQNPTRSVDFSDVIVSENKLDSEQFKAVEGSVFVP